MTHRMHRIGKDTEWGFDRAVATGANYADALQISSYSHAGVPVRPRHRSVQEQKTARRPLSVVLIVSGTDTAPS